MKTLVVLLGGLLLASFAACKKDGPTKEYWQGKLAAEGNYRNGKKDGRWIFYYASGAKQQETFFADEVQNGACREWHENGRLKAEYAFKDGQRGGTETRWHKNGVKSEQTTWVNGKEDGAYERWDEHGALRTTGRYAHGLKVGRWSEILPSGEPWYVENYDDHGNMVGSKTLTEVTISPDAAAAGEEAAKRLGETLGAAR